ncbi:MAG: RES family NAD+ phosphorylase [Flavobacteriales bacterium]|nr:RES family NAD+ phosphorylase [Flavobacteriales bacterium]
MEFSRSVYRITKAKYANDLRGLGAYKVGGRWNSRGNFVLYTASSISLAILENLVHFSIRHIPVEMSIVKISLPDDSFQLIERSELNSTWSDLPLSRYTQNIGDRWIMSQESLVLVIPSVVNIHEYNYLINPNHPRFKDVSIEEIIPFDIDDRLAVNR